jgi:hypothetical protein
MLKNVDINCDPLDCYRLDDQPTTCGLCGARTDFEEINEVIQLHECLNSDCGYKFITEEDKSSF